jgi:hypothetical protein
MKTKLTSAVVLGTALFASGALAQNVVTPTTPAPSVIPAQTQPMAAPAPSQTIFSSRLPTPLELTNAAASQGLGIDRIEQTSSQVIVVYKYADGQTKAVAYQLLPGASGTAVTAAAPTVEVVAAPAPAAIYYEAAPRVIYYDPVYYPYAYGRGWYPPVSLNLGLGFGFRGGGYRRGHW